MMRMLRIVLVAFLLVVASATTAAAAPPVRSGGLSGFVYGHLSGGVPGARVTAYALPGLQAGCSLAGGQYQPVTSTTTDGSGHYQLNVVAGHYRVGVVPPNLQAESFGYWLWPQPPGTGPNVTSWVGYGQDVVVPTNGVSGINVKLAAPGSISGTASYGSSGLPGVLVQAFAGGGVGAEPENLYYAPSGYVPSAVTGDGGSFTIYGLPRDVPDPVSTPLNAINNAERYMVTMTDTSGAHEPWISPPGPFASIDNASGTATGIAGTLRATPRILGQVVNEKGRPVAGISVTPWGKMYALPPVTTDSKGRFVTSNFTDAGNGVDVYLYLSDPAGNYRSLWYPGVEYQAYTSPAFRTGSDVTITQKMVGGAATVSGSAWYPTSMPSAGALIGAYSAGQGPFGQNQAMWQAGYATANCDGTFRLTGLWPGTHSLFASPPLIGQDWTPQGAVTSIAGGSTFLGTIQLPAWHITGYVTHQNPDLTISPVGNAQVSVYSYVGGWYQVDGNRQLVDWTATGIPSGSTLTDGTGRFDLWLPFSQSMLPVHLAVTGASGYYDTWYGYGGQYPIANFYDPAFVTSSAGGLFGSPGDPNGTDAGTIRLTATP